jgi:hypothetical protein
MEIAEQLVNGHRMAIRTTKKSVNLYVKWMMNQVFDYSCTQERLCAHELWKQLG